MYSWRSSSFKSSAFYGRIAQDYRDGAGWLFAADLHTLVAKGQEHETAEARQVAGVVHLLTSSKALYFLQEHWDLTSDEAAELLGWTIDVVTRHAGERRRKR